MASESGIFKNLVGKSVDSLSVVGTRFDPKRNGMIGALLALVISAIGAMMTATFIGVASIPTGIVIAVQMIVGGLRTWVVEFVYHFFLPIQIVSSCTLGGSCESPELTVAAGGPLIQSAGIAGLLVATLGFGAALYGVSTVVNL